MLDLKAIRRDPDPVRAALARRRDGRAVARRQLSARVEQRSVKVESD